MRALWAYGVFSFATPENRRLIKSILAKHATRTGVELLGSVNAGNHLHLRAQFGGRSQYCNFIRSVTGEIAKKLKLRRELMTGLKTGRFWDLRPFSSIISGVHYLEKVIDYLKINDLEGQGFTRAVARGIVKKWRDNS